MDLGVGVRWLVNKSLPYAILDKVDKRMTDLSGKRWELERSIEYSRKTVREALDGVRVYLENYGRACELLDRASSLLIEAKKLTYVEDEGWHSRVRYTDTFERVRTFLREFEEREREVERWCPELNLERLRGSGWSVETVEEPCIFVSASGRMVYSNSWFSVEHPTMSRINLYGRWLTCFLKPLVNRGVGGIKMELPYGGREELRFRFFSDVKVAETEQWKVLAVPLSEEVVEAIGEALEVVKARRALKPS